MQTRHLEIYQNLMNLVETDDAFFFKDFTLDDVVYRIFNYRLASWTSFQKPDAKWARGIMFDVTDASDVRLVCMPPEKFFNWAEGDVDHSEAEVVMKMDKLDGSLISTYAHKGELRLKTKGSLFSEQAIAAMKWLGKPENAELKEYLEEVVFVYGGTVNLEYTAPTNRVVIGYMEEQLRCLNIVFDDETYAYEFHALDKKYVVNSQLVVVEDQQKFVDEIESEQEGEGYVVLMRKDSGEEYLVKIKNRRYCALHLAKDSITSPKRLFECVIDESSDDLRTMFETDPVALMLINQMETKVQPIFNHLIARVESFYDANKTLDRKSYAIKAQTEAKDIMGLLMSLYIGRPVDYKAHAKKYREEIFGISDAVAVSDE